MAKSFSDRYEAKKMAKEFRNWNEECIERIQNKRYDKKKQSIRNARKRTRKQKYSWLES